MYKKIIKLTYKCKLEFQIPIFTNSHQLITHATGEAVDREERHTFCDGANSHNPFGKASWHQQSKAR